MLRVTCEFRAAMIAFFVLFSSAWLVGEEAQGPSKWETDSSAYAVQRKDVPAGLRLRVAVMDFENKAGGEWGAWRIGEGMAEQLTTALMESGKFTVLERQKIDQVLQEQDLGASGRVWGATAPKIGKVIGAQVLIYGAVTEFKSVESAGVGRLRINDVRLGVKGSNAHVALDLRLVDATTGQVIASKRAEAKAAGRGFDFAARGHDASGGFGLFKGTAIGEAVRLAIEDAVNQVASELKDTPWESKVLSVENDVAFIRGGADSGITKDMLFDVYRLGEALVDPDSGAVLGQEKEKIAQVKVFEVEEKYAKARVVSGSGVAKGDLVLFAR